ncbi:unnamed protein product [Heligmosomoides polygyrus]|uniref:Transposase n=1 Tax=Heligmosomoides polygyrus TaxID=6339 RepID=A0A183GUC8_HELPZ|nr:unnamed protein product [Heligmosomoides polygyrus]
MIRDKCSEVAEISGPKQAAQIEKDLDGDLYLQRGHAYIAASVEGLNMQARKIKYVAGLTETRRRHSLHATYESGEDMFL